MCSGRKCGDVSGWEGLGGGWEGLGRAGSWGREGSGDMRDERGGERGGGGRRRREEGECESVSVLVCAGEEGRRGGREEGNCAGRVVCGVRVVYLLCIEKCSVASRRLVQCSVICRVYCVCCV